MSNGVPENPPDDETRPRSQNFEAMAQGGEAIGYLSTRNRHLKWRAFDYLEIFLTVICGLLLVTFTVSVAVDVLSRNLGHSFLFLQELTLGTFVWGVFLGAAVALRRGQHFYLTRWAKKLTGAGRTIMEVIGLGAMLIVFVLVTYYGYRQFLVGFRISMQVSSRPLALLTGSVPVFGLLGLLFTFEELTNGLRGGFDKPVTSEAEVQLQQMEEQTADDGQADRGDQAS